ncbi:MAG: Lrp/AsnC family transcriptional regulator [Persephonella sp.]|nr:MAG: Lrp/AsnC family transcriptional regulator [Persephonella sp.]
MENEKQTAETPLAFEKLFKDIDLKDRAKAYVLVEAKPVEIPYILEELSKIKNVLSADVVTGIYDIIVFIEGEDQNEIGRVVIRDINSIKGVKKATTCMVVRI